MMWHFFEVWLLLLVVFVAGCTLGATLYAGIGNSVLANAQGAFADWIGDLLDRLKTRFGLEPDWREAFRPRAERPVRRRPRRHREADAGDYSDSPRTRHEADEPFEEGDREAGDQPAADGDGWADAAYGEEEFADRDEPVDGGDAPRALSDPVQTPVDDLTVMRPAGLAGPRNGVPDHLQRIRGIGKANEELLNSFGIFHFGQIAAWTPAEVRWITARMPFPETIERDDWIGQATVLASGGDTGYVKSAEKRRVKRATNPSDGDAG